MVGVVLWIMGFGLVLVVCKVLVQIGLILGQMDVIELNEVFVVQVLVVICDLGLLDDVVYVNFNGGVIVLGYLFGVFGGWLVMIVVYQLKWIGGCYVLCIMCIGVGQGIVLIIECV